MDFGGYGFGGYPATKATGYSKSTPIYSKFTKPGGFGKGFGKPFGKMPFPPIPPVGFGKGFGGFPTGKGFGKGFPATKSSGYSSYLPTTTVATSPYPGAI